MGLGRSDGLWVLQDTVVLRIFSNQCFADFVGGVALTAFKYKAVDIIVGNVMDGQGVACIFDG